MNKPILCLDFDGVCSTYESGWQGADVCNDPPVPGLFEFLEEAYKEFDIQILSSRSHQDGGIACMMNWFNRHYLEHLRKTNQLVDSYLGCHLINYVDKKPPAFVTIDDRALTFIGQWPSIEELKRFQPWFKKFKVVKQEE